MSVIDGHAHLPCILPLSPQQLPLWLLYLLENPPIKGRSTGINLA